MAMQRDMLDTKAMFKAAQRLRNVSLSQKASIEAKIAVSATTCQYLPLLYHWCATNYH